MKKETLLIITFAVIAMTACKSADDQTTINTPTRDYFQLSIYNYETAEQEMLLDNHFRDALLPALHRSGIENVGVFKPIEGLNEGMNYVMVLTPFTSLDQFDQLPELLAKDAVYQQAGGAYINAPHDQSPYTRIESMILRGFNATPRLTLPELDTPREGRVYELRSYEGATEKLYERKVEMFNEGGEIALFEKLEFNAVFYGEVISGANMPNLIYMVSFENKKSHQEHWDAFRNHPDWDKLKNMERYANTVSHIDNWLLHPTDYSGI